MAKAIIAVPMRYKRRSEMKPLRHLLKYLQYRDGSVRREAFLSAEQGHDYRYPAGVSDHIRPAHRAARWVDRGMGETYRQIANRAYVWRGRSVLARTWVVSPDPELMRHVPEGRRFEVVRRVTEKTLERWYGDNGWGQPEYSYVIHDKHIADKRSMEFGEDKLPSKSQRKRLLPMAHAHVITPGTIPIDAAEDAARVDHYVKKPHIRDLNRAAAEAFTEELERVLGRERAREVLRERDARLERERYPDRERGARLSRLKAFGDVAELLRAEKAAREARKGGHRRRRTARQRQAELRLYARYASEERHRRREADRRRLALMRRQQHEAELQQERERTRRQIARACARGRRTPDLWEEEGRQRELLRAYFAQIAAERERIERARSHEMAREIER